MQSNKSCQILEQYLNYLTIIKCRAENTIKEYRTDILMFFRFLSKTRSYPVRDNDFSWVDIDFINSISLADMYSFITYCQEQLHSSPGTRARKIVSLRQFWKYLKSKACLIDNNIADGLESPRLPKRLPKYLTLEESVKLLIACHSSTRDHCIITILLNCALRLSEIASLNIDQVDNNSLTICGKGNKERKIFLTPAAKKAIFKWLQERQNLKPDTNALFVSRSQGA